ncbi:AMP-binding protein [Sphingomonas sp.]|jgi:acyl-CoA synthetase (AMP-forming)/AMP-acid ligase II|uniref:AMP-binding protein n=1 Tax=Sphingomonas sp. TaxID=28214 RepID=UPI00262E9F20|nr:AMP-binding protein [Sphingomonas sp.]MDF2493790.1 acyl-CoA synthetase [Sphingomonas sp.]
MHPRHFSAQTPDKPAYIMAGSGEVVTYAQLEDRANQVAHWLRDQGVRAGDVVALMAENHPRLYEFIWGAQRIGVHYLLIATALTASEVDYILRDSNAAIAILSAQVLNRLDHPPFPCRTATLDDDLIATIRHYPAAPVSDEAPGTDMLYSSGTTGFPNGIKSPLPVGFEQPTRAVEIGSRYFGYAQDSVYLCPAPLYHAAPLRWSLAVHRLGGTVILMEKFDAAAALAAIARHRVTIAQLVPTHLARMLALPAAERAAHDLSSLRSVFHAGAPCPVYLKYQAIDWLGPIVGEFYSGTEGVGLTVATCDDWLAHPGTVGRAVQGELRICDEDGEALPIGEEGLVRFANPNPFAYHNDPDRTAAAYNQHGWPTLGDIGRIDADGFLYLTDRANFMIISGGVNIYPQEVENRLVEHAQVADAAVIGLPDAEMGERVVALVEPRSWPIADPAAFARALDGFLREGLSPVKVPRRYVFRQTLERTDAGKLVKRRLRDALLAEDAGAVTV